MTNIDLTRIDKAISQLTEEMNVIFSQYPECEAPEFMPEEPRKAWELLHAQRHKLWEFGARIEQVYISCIHYINMEIA